MIRQILLIAVLFFSLHLNAQTGIGTTTPDPSAKLEVKATDKGFLPPRVALTATNSATPIASPATGLIIYNTATAGTTPNNVLPGYYYWDGSKWNGLVDQGALNSFSGYVPNYAQSNASRVTNVTTSNSTVVSQSITSAGRPIQIIASGDANPLSNGGWCQLQLYRDGTAIGKKVQVESSSANENVPYCLNFIDNPTAGTYTYSVKVVSISSTFDFGEADGNQITLLELGAWSAGTMPVSKGGTGNSSYTAGSVMFSDGTSIAQNNSNLFWDNTNGRLGIGTNNPTSKLNVNGGGVKLVTGFGNSTNRPSLNSSNIGNYEIRGVGSISGNAQNDLADDGFLRLSAGGGTSVSSQSSIDISGFSTIADMSNNIVMRTNGTERLRIDNSGNVNVTGKINLTDPTGNVAMKVAGFVDAGSFVTLDNLKATVTTSGARGLAIATVSGTMNLYVQGIYVNGVGSISASRTDGTVAYTTTLSGSLFGWSFGTAGDSIIYHFTDLANARVYRVTLIIMPSYIKNFISIERLI